MSHSANAKDHWRETVGTTPPQVPSHRWGAKYEGNAALASDWPRLRDLVNTFTSADDSKSKTAKSMQ